MERKKIRVEYPTGVVRIGVPDFYAEVNAKSDILVRYMQAHPEKYQITPRTNMVYYGGSEKDYYKNLDLEGQRLEKIFAEYQEKRNIKEKIKSVLIDLILRL